MPLIERLDRAEREKGDVLKLLVDGMATAYEDEDAEQTVAWLAQRQHQGELPYLYVLGLYHGKLKGDRRKLEGIDYFARGTLVYGIDAARCGDPSAMQAVPAAEKALGLDAVRDSLRRKRPDLRAKAVRAALAWEEKDVKRARPEWICRQGTKPGSPAPDAEALQAHRLRVRGEFEKDF